MLRAMRLLRRAAACVAYATGVAAVWFLIAGPLLGHDAKVPSAAAAARPPARPAGLPRTVPGWAWKLYAWHATPAARRGPPPLAAPRTIPDWYWRWRSWRAALARVDG
jgi:hypothetical protein